MKRAGDAPPHEEFPAGGWGCGGFHALDRCSREWSSAPPCQALFSAAVFFDAVRSVASVGIEDEDGTVFAADLDRLAGVGALVERVETRIIHGCTLLRRAQ